MKALRAAFHDMLYVLTPCFIGMAWERLICNQLFRELTSNIINDLRGTVAKVEPGGLRGVVAGETEVGRPETVGAGADAEWVVEGEVATPSEATGGRSVAATCLACYDDTRSLIRWNHSEDKHDTQQ